MVRNRHVPDEREPSPAKQELTAICETLQVPEPLEAAALFCHVQEKVRLFELHMRERPAQT